MNFCVEFLRQRMRRCSASPIRYPLSPSLLLETAHAGASPAPDVTATVAPFRAWRGSRVVVAEKPT